MEDQNNKQNIIIATMQKDIDYIKKAIDKLTGTVEKHIDDCDEKYADKWTEGVLKFVMGAFGIGIIGAIIAVIIK